MAIRPIMEKKKQTFVIRLVSKMLSPTNISAITPQVKNTETINKINKICKIITKSPIQYIEKLT